MYCPFISWPKNHFLPLHIYSHHFFGKFLVIWTMMCYGQGIRTKDSPVLKPVLDPNEVIPGFWRDRGQRNLQMPLKPGCIGPFLCQILGGLWHEGDSSQEHNQNRFEITLNESQAKHLEFLKGTVTVLNYSVHVKRKFSNQIKQLPQISKQHHFNKDMPSAGCLPKTPMMHIMMQVVQKWEWAAQVFGRL